MWGKALGFKEKEGAVPEVFAMILYLKIVAYRGKVFQGRWTLRRGLLSAPLALGRGGGACNLGREPQSLGLGALS